MNVDDEVLSLEVDETQAHKKILKTKISKMIKK